jgi:hypothetical protein
MDVQSRAPTTMELEAELLHVMQSRCNPRWYEDLRCCTPQLCQLFYDAADWSHEQFEQAVRQIIIEHCCVDEGGDAIGFGDQSLEKQVRTIIAALNKRREQLQSSGEYGIAPVPPMMFG